MSESADKTAEVLRGMFVENTGSSFLDSGGTPKYDANGKYIGSEHGYGRNHERNKLRDLDNEPPVHLKFRVYKDDKVEIEFSLNTYLWLKERCLYNPELDELFHGKFLEEKDPDDSKEAVLPVFKPWLVLMEEFPEYLSTLTEDDGSLIYGEPGGIYGEGEPFTVNTYNHESNLDQTLQYTYFTNTCGEFIILQVHGGADVRGGYTKPRVFSVGNLSELDIMDDQRGAIYCTGKDHHPDALAKKEVQESQTTIPGADVPLIDFDGHEEHNWTTDDGYHWYLQGTCGAQYKQLETHSALDLDEEVDEVDEGDEKVVWEPGILCVKDGVGYCPICGGKLEGSAY